MSNKINPEYRKRIEDIKVEGEDFANSAMKGVYLEQKEALDELHRMIGKIYIDHCKDGFLNFSAAQKAKITADVKAKLKEIGINLAQSEVDTITVILAEVFTVTYYKTLYTLDSGVKVSMKFNILKKEFVDSAVNQVFKGELFSDRIWTNKADMIDKLQSSIIEAMKGNITIDKIGRNIRDTFNVTAYESQRLVRTETARIATQATYEVAKNTGIKQVMYSATLDSKTSSECAALDGKVWDIDDPEIVFPPQNHPQCRCVLCNVPYENWQPDQRKDNSTGELIPYQTYSEWAKDKGIKNIKN